MTAIELKHEPRLLPGFDIDSALDCEPEPVRSEAEPMGKAALLRTFHSLVRWTAAELERQTGG